MLRLPVRLTRSACLATLSLLSIVFATPARATVDAAVLASQEWREVRTEHFRVLTNGGEGKAASVARRLEQFHAMLAVRFPGLRAYPVLPLEIFVFRDQASLDAFVPVGIEDPAGFTLPARGRFIFAMNAQIEGLSGEKVACHELTHIFLHTNFGGMPAWLDEGLAGYYETFRQRGDRAEFGHRVDPYLYWLKQNELTPLNVLFALQRGGRAYNSNNGLREATYIEGWAIAHWLQARPERAAQFDSVLADVRRGRPLRASFERQFPVSTWPDLVAQVHQYAKDDMLEHRTVPAAAPSAANIPYDVRPVGEVEALVRLGDLLWASGPTRYQDSHQLLGAALARDSSSAAAHCALGCLYTSESDYEKARVYLRRARELAPGDVRIALFAGLADLDRANALARDGRFREPDFAATVERARTCFNDVLKAQPENPEALAGFGATFLIEGKMPDAAYRALASACTAMPDREDLTENLKFARELKEKLARGGEALAVPPAAAAGDHADTSETGSASTGARGDKWDWDPERFNDLAARVQLAVGRQEFDDALRMLREMRTLVHDPEVHGQIDDSILTLEVGKGLRHAYELMKANKYRSAQRELRQLLALSPKEADRVRIDKMLAEAERVIRAYPNQKFE